MARAPKGAQAEGEQLYAEDRERLRQATEQLLSCEGWQRWVALRARSGLARFSVSNQLLIALARPDASFVAGFWTWLQLGYLVKRGEEAIRLFVRMPTVAGARQTDEKSGERFAPSTVVAVFDRRQVAPLPGAERVDLEPRCVQPYGHSHSHLIAPLQRFVESLGFSVSFEVLDGSTDGWCDLGARRIAIDTCTPANAQLRTLIHQAARVLGSDHARFGQGRFELIVDTVSHIASSSVGFDFGEDALPCMGGWGSGVALDVLSDLASSIDGLARRLEGVLDGVPAEAPPLRAIAPAPHGEA